MCRRGPYPDRSAYQAMDGPSGVHSAGITPNGGGVRKSDQVIMIVSAVAGFGYGVAVVLTFPQRHAPFWIVWMAFAVATTTAAGGLAGYGRSCWHELNSELDEGCKVRIRQVAVPVA